MLQAPCKGGNDGNVVKGMEKGREWNVFLTSTEGTASPMEKKKVLFTTTEGQNVKEFYRCSLALKSVAGAELDELLRFAAHFGFRKRTKSSSSMCVDFGGRQTGKKQQCFP